MAKTLPSNGDSDGIPQGRDDNDIASDTAGASQIGVDDMGGATNAPPCLTTIDTGATAATPHPPTTATASAATVPPTTLPCDEVPPTTLACDDASPAGLHVLLVGFFAYWRQFDFESDAVSTRLGRAVPLQDLPHLQVSSRPLRTSQVIQIPLRSYQHRFVG